MNKKRNFGIIIFTIIMIFSIIACDSGGKVLINAEALKDYLDKQPANSQDKPIKVIMNVNDLMLKDIVEVINSAGKFVVLDFSRSTGLTTIGERVFRDNKALTGIILPISVTNIEREAFLNCTNLKEISVGNDISNIGSNAFRNCNNLTNITVVGVDKSLNGKWYKEEYELFFTFNNGSMEVSQRGEDNKYAYTTQDDNLYIFDFSDNYMWDYTYYIDSNTLTLKNIQNEELIFIKQ